MEFPLPNCCAGFLCSLSLCLCLCLSLSLCLSVSLSLLVSLYLSIRYLPIFLLSWTVTVPKNFACGHFFLKKTVYYDLICSSIHTPLLPSPFPRRQSLDLSSLLPTTGVPGSSTSHRLSTRRFPPDDDHPGFKRKTHLPASFVISNLSPTSL